MNEALEKVKERLDENNVKYIEDEDEIIINNYNDEIGMPIRYVIAAVETVKPTYRIVVISSSITKANNEIEMLKVINHLNNRESLIRYLISDEKNIHVMSINLSQIDVVAVDQACLDQDIAENYKDLMKSNWSEEVL